MEQNREAVKGEERESRGEGPAAPLARRHRAAPQPAAPARPGLSGRPALQISRTTVREGRPRRPSPLSLPSLPPFPEAACPRPGRRRGGLAGGVGGRGGGGGVLRAPAPQVTA